MATEISRCAGFHERKPVDEERKSNRRRRARVRLSACAPTARLFTFEMSGDKRKQRLLGSYIINSKRKEIGFLAIEQLDVDQPSHADHEEPPTDGKTLPTPSDNLEALDADDVDPCCGNEMESVVDSHPDTHDNDIGYQLSMKICLTDDIKHRLLTNPFRPDQKYAFPDRRGKDGTIRRFMSNWLIENELSVL